MAVKLVESSEAIVSFLNYGIYDRQGESERSQTGTTWHGKLSGYVGNSGGVLCERGTSRMVSEGSESQ